MRLISWNLSSMSVSSLSGSNSVLSPSNAPKDNWLSVRRNESIIQENATTEIPPYSTIWWLANSWNASSGQYCLKVYSTNNRNLSRMAKEKGWSDRPYRTYIRISDRDILLLAWMTWLFLIFFKLILLAYSTVLLYGISQERSTIYDGLQVGLLLYVLRTY